MSAFYWSTFLKTLQIVHLNIIMKVDYHYHLHLQDVSNNITLIPMVLVKIPLVETKDGEQMMKKSQIDLFNHKFVFIHFLYTFLDELDVINLSRSMIFIKKYY